MYSTSRLQSDKRNDQLDSFSEASERSEREGGRLEDAPPIRGQPLPLEHRQRLLSIRCCQRKQFISRNADRVPFGAPDADPFDVRDGEVGLVERESRGAELVRREDVDAVRVTVDEAENWDAVMRVREELGRGLVRRKEGRTSGYRERDV
jgi:hypothetical protein